MNTTTQIFVISACSVIIGWAGINVHNHYQRLYRENAFNECSQEPDYVKNVRASRQLQSSGYIVAASIATQQGEQVLKKCLLKFNLVPKK